MMSSQHSSYDRFATTRWSVIMRTAASASPDASTALTELVQRYWYPVYAYTRCCGHPPSIAQEVARSFLAILMLDFRSGTGLHANGQFRRFLLERLNEFLADDWREAVEAENEIELLAPADLEARYQCDHVDTHSPEQAYQRSFALELLRRALKRLRSEATRSGHLQMYTALEPCLAREPTREEYEATAAQLGTRPLALIVALKRLRQRLRELVGEELADTVTSQDELAIEQAEMHRILSETPPEHA